MWKAGGSHDSPIGCGGNRCGEFWNGPMVWKSVRPCGWIFWPWWITKNIKPVSNCRQNRVPSSKKQCPQCVQNSWTTQFNLMFKTHMGPVEDQKFCDLFCDQRRRRFCELRQRKLQAVVLLELLRSEKSFPQWNPPEIHLPYREFRRMEMQYFVKPGTDESFYDQWKQTWSRFFARYGGSKKLAPSTSPLALEELAHYAKAAVDVQYKFPMGWQELEGIHNRSDLICPNIWNSAEKVWNTSMKANKEKYIPYVIETAVGCDRLC